MLKKNLKFVLNRGDDTITFNLCFILLIMEVDLIAEKQSNKKIAFRVRGISYIEIILELLTKIVTFYMQVFIIQVGIPGLIKVIVSYKIYLKPAIFLVFNK